MRTPIWGEGYIPRCQVKLDSFSLYYSYACIALIQIFFLDCDENSWSYHESWCRACRCLKKDQHAVNPAAGTCHKIQNTNKTAIKQQTDLPQKIGSEAKNHDQNRVSSWPELEDVWLFWSERWAVSGVCIWCMVAGPDGDGRVPQLTWCQLGSRIWGLHFSRID